MAALHITGMKGYPLMDKEARKKLEEHSSQFQTIANKTVVENGKLYLVREDGTKIDTGTTLPTSSSGSGTGGSSEEEGWRLINEITTTEEVNSISITEDSDGNAFELEEILIEGNYYSSETNTVTSNVGITAGRWFKTNLTIQKTNVYAYHSARFQKIGKRITSYFGVPVNWRENNNGIGGNLYMGSYLDCPDKIARISIGLINTSCVLGIGTNIKIYGR